MLGTIGRLARYSGRQVCNGASDANLPPPPHGHASCILWGISSVRSTTHAGMCITTTRRRTTIITRTGLAVEQRSGTGRSNSRAAHVMAGGCRSSCTRSPSAVSTAYIASTHAHHETQIGENRRKPGVHSVPREG